jgi:hypothetical protein
LYAFSRVSENLTHRSVRSLDHEPALCVRASRQLLDQFINAHSVTFLAILGAEHSKLSTHGPHVLTVEISQTQQPMVATHAMILSMLMRTSGR